jgi:hypothetical protein
MTIACSYNISRVPVPTFSICLTQLHNPGYEHILWDRAKAEAFLQERHPW